MTGSDGGLLRGVVRGTGGGIYRVALEDGSIVEASLRGRLKKDSEPEDWVVIGDRVALLPGGGGHTIEEALPRTSRIVRRRPRGGGPKVVAANVDRVIVVMAAREPDPRLTVIDRLLALAESDDIPAILVVNKVDLPEAGPAATSLAELYGEVGYPVLLLSAKAGTGLDALADVLHTGTSALIGPSGAGKSSLLNAIEPGLGLRTGELSRKLARGRHTTVSSRLIALEGGGLVADTPGFGEVGVWGVDPAELDRCFREFVPYLGSCRFPDCAHEADPGCAVLEGVEAGEIARSRYESYLALRREGRSARPRG